MLKFNKKKVTSRHILVTFLNWKDKEKILQESRQRKQVTYKRVKVRLTSPFSLATLNAEDNGTLSREFKGKMIFNQELYTRTSYNFCTMATGRHSQIYRG